jgi:hypothetical protein
MANKKYSQYANITSLADGDFFPCETAAGVTKYSLWSLIKSTLKTYFDTLYAPMYPVGAFYVQYPDADSNTLATALPDAKNPATLFGGTWAAQWTGANEGSFFCTEGTRTGDADAITVNRTNGLQPDHFQGWQLGSSADASGAKDYWGEAVNRDFSISGTSTGGYALPQINTGFKGGGNMLKAMDDNTNGAPRIAKSTYPTNRLIRVWKRTA